MSMTQEEFNQMMDEYVKTHGAVTNSKNDDNASTDAILTAENKQPAMRPVPSLTPEQIEKARELAPRMFDFIWTSIYKTTSPYVTFKQMLDYSTIGAELLLLIVGSEAGKLLSDVAEECESYQEDDEHCGNGKRISHNKVVIVGESSSLPPEVRRAVAGILASMD